MRFFLSLIFLIFPALLFGQGETNNWYFGNNAGLNFSSGDPIALTDGQLDTAEGCASISDSSGQLLFYTDGVTVWNRNHDIMFNGTGLNGDFSSTNSAIIVPNPINDNIYYIFTVDVPSGLKGMQYSEVDLTLDSSLGGVTTKNILLDPFTSEKLTAVQKNNLNEFWVVSHRLDSNEFISFSVDGSGVNTTPVVSAVGASVNNVDQGSSQGQMKISPDGTKLAAGRGGAAIGLFLYDFDSTTGIVSNEQIIFDPPPPPVSIDQNVYGIEFSPNSQFLYSNYFEGGSELSVIYQYDTLAGDATDILNSEVELLRDFVGLLGSLQLASNGKIYFADFFSMNIGVINSPDEPGLNADIVNEAINLQGRTAVLGLPPFIQSYFITSINFSNTCFGDTTNFNLNDSVDTITWDFDDPASGFENTSNLPDPTHIFTSPGIYNVSAEITFQSITSIFETVVEIFPLPTITPLLDQIACDDDADGFGAFDTTTIDQELLNGQTDISITYVDGSGNPLSSPLPNPYTNGIINQENIIATLTNDTTGCTNTTTVTFQVADPPAVDNTIDLFACDDNLDGFAPFNTSNVENDLTLGNTSLTVTYVDGNGNPLSSPLPNPLQNNIANNETITATITDPATSCTSSAVINLTIVGEPQIVPITTFGVCDDDLDGSDTNGFVNFNLLSKEAEILDGQTNITITYYESQVDLDNGNEIPDPSIFYSDNTTIFILLENTDATGNCSGQTTFDIEVFAKPVLNPGPILLAQCDIDQDGFAPFNLTEAQTLLSTNYQNETFIYTDSNGVVISNPTSYTNTVINNETVNVRVISGEDCFRETSFVLEVDTSQIPDTFLLNYFSCSPTANGIATFDFSDATAQVLALFPAGQLLTVSYYETQQEAELEINPIGDSSTYENNTVFTTNNIQDIWVRVDGDNANDCRGLGVHVRLEILPNPTFLPTITPLEVCSPIANAFTFDLTQKDAEINGGDPNILLTYYENVGNYTAMNAIANPTAFPNSSNPQTIYYSLENATTGCTTFDLVNLAMQFEIIVNQNPVLVTPSELQVCDDDGVADGFTTVDLSQKDAEITGGFDSNLTVTYHLTAAGAASGDASIPDKTMFTTTANPQIVVARVTDNTTACFSTINLSIRTFPVPVPVVPADYEECDDDNDGVLDFFILSSRDTEITGGDPTLTVAYYLTQADADNAPAGQELDNMMYINNDPFEQIVFARVFNGAGCFATVPLTLRVLNTPMPNENPDDYPLCDDNADGLQIFDLTSQELNILGTLDPATHSVVWFSSLASAEAGTPAIATPGAYTSNTATVFAVVTDTGQMTTTMTFCSNIAALELIVNPQPTPIQPAEYELCYDLDSGSDTDEFSTFDLRSRDDEITGGNDDWAVSYHLTQADADAGTPVLTDLYQNVVMANQTVFARVEDIVTGCFDTITLTLVVNPLPSPTTIAAVEECDTMANDGDADNDGDAVFDLTGQVTIDIINGETFMALTFHETAEAAELGTPAIPNPANYETVSRTIFVRATDTDPATATECFRIVELELIVQPAPVLPAVIPDLTECDDNGDGQELFDLTQNDATIYGAQNPADFNLTYHETLASAEAMVGSAADMPIADPVNYLASGATTPIFVRLENGTTGCSVIGTFNLNIAMIPTITPPGLFEECDSEGALVGTDDDGITTFDLTSLDAGITGGDATLSVTYYESQADLDAGLANAIPTPDAYINDGTNPQTIFILVMSDQAGMCGAQTTVDLQVNPLPVIGEPLPPAIACDEDNDGFGEFDLQQYNDDLLIPLTNIILRFYETLDNAQADTGAGEIDITVPYNNITGMTSLYVVAQDTDPATATACAKIYEFDLIVFPIPELPATLDTLTECDEDNNLMEIIDLTQNEAAIIGTQDPTTLVITYHNTLADADTGNNPIVDPANYDATQVTPLEVIWVRLQVNDGTPNNCAAMGSFEISVETPPTANPANDDLDLMICDDDTDTFNVFDLTVNEASLTGDDPLLTVTYFESLAAQTAGTPIADPTAYTNILNSQTIQAVVSSAAGCTDQTTFDIEVLPLPTPNLNPDPLELCDDDSDGDSANGLTMFDLTDAITQIGGGEPVDILVYTDLAFAEANPDDPTLAIPDVTAFINTVPGNQTLFARVERNVPGDDDLDNDGNLCFVIVPFEVVVNPLPILAEAGPINYTFCEEFDGDDTMGSLDLTTLADEVGILANPQVTSDFIISYHNLLVQAQANTAALSTLYTVADGEEIFVRIENMATGCENFTSIIFTVESRPEVFPAENIVQCADDLGINIEPNQNEATFDLTQQNAVITGGEPSTSVTYYTSLADAESMINAIDTPGAFVNTSNPQQIFARAINTTSGCESTMVVDFEIFVQPLPYTDLTNEGGQICVDKITGEALDPFTIDGTVESPQIGVTYSYAWTLDGALTSLDPVVTVAAAGTYQVLVTATFIDGTECDYIAEAVYSAESAPVFEAIVVESSFNSSGLYTVEVINVTGANLDSEYEFALDDGPFQSSQTFTNVTPGTHTIFGRLASGNCSISEFEIGIIDYPRFFTPNADGFHDTWNIIGLGVAPNLNAKIFIFDRYGKLLKQISPTSAGWDGTFNGQPMPSNDYWFRVEFTEVDEVGTQRTVNGHFTLKR